MSVFSFTGKTAVLENLISGPFRLHSIGIDKNVAVELHCTMRVIGVKEKITILLAKEILGGLNQVLYYNVMVPNITNPNLQTKHYCGWKLREALPSVNSLRLA